MPNDLQGHAIKGNAVPNSSNLDFRPLQVRRAIVLRTAARDGRAQSLPDFIQTATGIQMKGHAAGMTLIGTGLTDSPEGLSIALPLRANELHWLWLSQDSAVVASPVSVGGQIDQVLAQADGQTLLHAVDLTDAQCAFELRGSQAHGVLQRLADVLSFPAKDFGFSRLRLVDIPASLIRLAEGHYLIVADVHHADYILEWVTHAIEGMEEKIH